MLTLTLQALATCLLGSSLIRTAPVGRAVPAGITDTVILQYACQSRFSLVMSQCDGLQ